MQQWYECTTTKGAAGLSMYINITTTAKGAELCKLDSWEGVLSCRTELLKSIKARQFHFKHSTNARTIDTFRLVLPLAGLLAVLL